MYPFDSDGNPKDSMKRIIFTAAAVIFLSCANTQKITAFHSEQSVSSLLIDTLDKFEATGDVAFSIEGERYRGKMTVSLLERTNFVCYFYTPFAQLIASITSDEDSATVIVEERKYRIGINDNLSSIPYFTVYPFSFNDFIRIITGRIFKRDCFNLDADNVAKKGRRIVYEWITDSLHISVMVSNNGRKIKNIIYAATNSKDGPWELEFSSFKNGISKEIRFESKKKNYFSLVLNKVRF